MIAARLSVQARDLYTHVPAVDAERARIVVVPVLKPGVAAMTIDRWILVRRGHEKSVGLLAHELVHVEQWRRLGVVRFLRAYVGAYLRGRRGGLGHWDAYRAIPCEAEARTRSGA